MGYQLSAVAFVFDKIIPPLIYDCNNKDILMYLPFSLND